MINFNKKAIGPVVATSLLIVVAVVALVGFQTWFQTYSSGVFSDVEIKTDSTNSNSNSGIETIIGENLYFKNNIKDNLSIIQIKIGSNICNISNNLNLSLGVQTINVKNCTNNLTTSSPEIFIRTKDNIYSKKVYLKDKIVTSNNVIPTQPILNCSNLDGGEWIKVPGNSVLGTNDFCVMKFEAKFVDLTGKTQDSNYKIWNYDSAIGNLNITSSANNEPIGNINQIQARQACQNLGSNYHLITNAEWTTIARNIELVDSNWDSNSVGNGNLWRGHTEGIPNSALSVSNINNYYDQTGNSNPSIERRVLILNNSELIWDLGGNMVEWTNDTCIQNSPWYTGGWVEWTDSNIIDSEKDLAGPIGSYASANAIGQYYGCNSNGAGFIRGGHWNNRDFAGIYFLSLNNVPSYLNGHFGFRCTYTP